MTHTETTFAVKCETKEGSLHTMRRGFKTAEDAENHPVKLSLWKRVWVEPEQTPVEETGEPRLPPFPWDWVSAGSPDRSGQVHAYLVDATGKKIGAIWGGRSRKLIADYLVEVANKNHETRNQ